MILAHTRSIAVRADGLFFRQGNYPRGIAFGSGLPEPRGGWVPVCLISFGDQIHCLKLVREHRSTYWFLDRDFSLVENITARFLVSASFAIDGVGPLDWAISTVRTDGPLEEAVEDLHALIEEFVLASSGLAEAQTRVLVGPEAAKDSAAMLEAIWRLNRPDRGAPEMFQEMTTKELVARGGLQAELSDGSILRFDIFLPVVNFWYVGFSSDPANPLCVFITDHTKIAVALFDARANVLYSRFHPGNVYVAASVLLRVRLWRQYLYPLLAAGRLRAARVGLAFRDNHIGHYIWNELSAVDTLLKMGRTVSVFIYPECNEPGFPVDTVFPEIAGHVHRNVTTSLPHLLAAVAGDVAFFPFMSYHISQGMADRLTTLAREAEPALVTSLANSRSRATVVLIGLRLENRTWIRQREGYSALIRRLGHRKGERFLVIFDGHNVFAGPGGGYLTSFRELPGAKPGTMPPLVRQEIELVDAVSRQAAEDGVNNVEILNLVPCSVSASIVSALACDFLITHWGAGLAKYKWVANAAGCIISARSVLSAKGDLRIYDSEEFRENATSLIYYPYERVRDLGSDSHAIRTGQPGRDDFDLDPEEFADFINSHIVQRCAYSTGENDVIQAAR